MHHATLGSWCQQEHHEMEQAVSIKGFLLSLCRENAHFFIPSSDWDHYYHLWRNQTPRRAEITNTIPHFQLQTSREIKTVSEMSVLSTTPKPGIEEYTEIVI